MLVSVKNLPEARIALAVHGVSIIDVKDPHNGSLGFAGADVINPIAAAVAGQRARDCDALGGPKPSPKPSPIPSAPSPGLSIAMGELTDHRPHQVCDIRWDDVDYVKFGLSGLYPNQAWRRPLSAAFSLIPDRVQKVLVLYVDQVSPKVATAMLQRPINASVVLLDTFDKTNGNAFAYWNVNDCQSLFLAATACGMATVMAGSIGLPDLPNAQRTNAQRVGVRGAVCEGPRDGNLSAIRLQSFLFHCSQTWGQRGSHRENDLLAKQPDEIPATAGPS